MSASGLRAATDAAQAAWDDDVRLIAARFAATLGVIDDPVEVVRRLYRLLLRETRNAATRGAADLAAIVAAAGVQPFGDATVDVAPPRNLGRTIARDWRAAASLDDPRRARTSALRRIVDLSLTDAWRDGMTAAMRSEDAVVGWRRVSRAGCCGACLALADGSVHDVDDPFPRHPFDRCIQEPVVRRVNDRSAGRPSPQQRWDAMTAAEQDEMFSGHGGEAKADRIRDGVATIADLVTFHGRNLNAQSPLMSETPLRALPEPPADGG